MLKQSCDGTCAELFFEQSLLMQIETTRKRFTVDDYYRMAEVGILGPADRVELIEGEIVEMSPIGDRHAMAVNRTNMVFARGLGDNVVVSVQNAVRVDRYNEPQPDIVLIRPREGFYGVRHPRPEDVVLLIEVADTTLRYDRDVKLPIYAKNGVNEVWIIDLKNDVIHVYREPKDGKYTVVEKKDRRESVSPQAFSSFAINVDDLLG
jgi:Uma2 family endonuclease